MRLGICFYERYEAITCRMHYSADTANASFFAMLMIVLQNINRLSSALAAVFDISSVKVTVITIVSADWADTPLLG
jgi:hypothetical protein